MFEVLFFHLVKMDEEKIDINVIQRFRSGVSVEKKSKKKFLAIFKFLTGKESPIQKLWSSRFVASKTSNKHS